MLNLIIRIAHALRRQYWRLVRPKTRGVRAVVANHNGQVLLVRHRYEKGWFLPGGKVKGNETDEAALRRELREEIGLSEIQNITKQGEYLNTYEYKRDTIVVFVVSSFSQQQKSHFEIAEQRFCNPRALPDDTSPGTRRRIAEWLTEQPKSTGW